MAVKVALTFDFDALSVWIGSYGSHNPATVSRGEFAAVAVPRILQLLAAQEVLATFCIPGHTALAYPDLVRRIRDAGHEIAHHGWVHEDPSAFSEAEERENLERGLEALQRVAGVAPEGYRSPAWRFSASTARILLDYGFLYDSSLMGSDFVPYYVRDGDRINATAPYGFGRNVDIVELPVSWFLDDFPHFEHAEDNVGLAVPSQVEAMWLDELDYARANVEDSLFNLTFHPQVIGRGHRIIMLARLIEAMKGCADVEFTRLCEFARAWREANPLTEWVRSGVPQAQLGAGREAPVRRD